VSSPGQSTLPTVASLNDVAIFDAIVWVWSNSEFGIASLFPMTMVTAIVSPRARPKPSITAPMMPPCPPVAT